MRATRIGICATIGFGWVGGAVGLHGRVSILEEIVPPTVQRRQGLGHRAGSQGRLAVDHLEPAQLGDRIVDLEVDVTLTRPTQPVFDGRVERGAVSPSGAASRNR